MGLEFFVDNLKITDFISLFIMSIQIFYFFLLVSVFYVFLGICPFHFPSSLCLFLSWTVERIVQGNTVVCLHAAVWDCTGRSSFELAPLRWVCTNCMAKHGVLNSKGVKCASFEASGFESCLYHFPEECLWAYYLISLNISFLLYKL